MVHTLIETTHRGNIMSKVIERPFNELQPDDQLMAWNNTKRELAVLKDREMEMRKYIIEQNSQGLDTDKIGTTTVELQQGWKLRAVIKQTYKLDPDADAVEKALNLLEDWQSDRLVKWSPSLSVTEYKLLGDAERAIVDSVLTISKGAPTLSLVPPKGS